MKNFEIKILIPLFLCLFLILASCQPTTAQTTPASSAQTSTVRPTIKLQPTSTKTPQPTPTATLLPHLQVEAENLKGTIIEYWYPWTGSMDQEIRNLTYEFNLENIWGIEVHLTAPGGSSILYDKFNQGLENGNLPNIVEASSEQLRYWHEEGKVLVDLNPYVSNPQWGLNDKEKADFQFSFMEQEQSDGEQFAIPAQRSLQVMFYNESWAKELGFHSAPETLEEFKKQACAAAAERKNIDETGGWILDYDPLTSLAWIAASGAEDVFDEEKSIYHFNNSKIENTFTFLNEMMQEGCAWPSRLSEPYDYFANRQALFYSGTLPEIMIQKESMTAAGNEDEWTILSFPTKNDVPVTITSGTSYAIRTSSPEEQLASWLFLRWMMLSENQASLALSNGTLPPGSTAIENIRDYYKDTPQWEKALLWIPVAQPTPRLSSWRLVRNVLEDAVWQIYQTYTKPEDVPDILDELQDIIPEVIKNSE